MVSAMEIQVVSLSSKFTVDAGFAVERVVCISIILISSLSPVDSDYLGKLRKTYPAPQ
jgi:hypothetical protein